MHEHVYELVRATGVHTPELRQGADAHGDAGASVVVAAAMRGMSDIEHRTSIDSRGTVVGKIN